MSINEVLFFYSKYSPKCKSITPFIKNISYTPICVDSRDVRKRIRNGKFFTIRAVPTLAVVYKNNDCEIYEGEKVIEWIRAFINSQQTPQYSSQEQILNEPIEPPPIEGDLGNAKSTSESGEEFEMLGDEPLEEPRQLDAKEERMVNTMDIARKMEEDRKRSLGYDEDKLPKGF
jgi:hypothetical protein